MAEKKAFIDYVQLHERTWGNETYPQRPSLAEILAAPVVVFWQNPPKNPNVTAVPTITIHDSLDALGAMLAKMFLRATVAGEKRYISRIYEGQKLVRITSVDVKFSREEG
ncbi:MAG: hypothetical protein AAF125_07890 [Chloroflexota bacterium]